MENSEKLVIVTIFSVVGNTEIGDRHNVFCNWKYRNWWLCLGFLLESEIQKLVTVLRLSVVGNTEIGDRSDLLFS